MRDDETAQSVASLRDAIQEIQGECGDMLVHLDDSEYHRVRASYVALQRAWGIIGAESAFLRETHPTTREAIRQELGLPRRP